MRRETRVEGGKVYTCGVNVATYNLTQEQHDMAAEAIKNGWYSIGGYELEEVDNETLEVWKDDAEDEEYKDFLALADDCYEVFTLNSVLGDFSQQIGEIIVY